jgi:hypothetical protein
MLLIVHIVSASISLIFSTFGLFFPSLLKLKISYIFIAATFLTGTLLIFEKNVSLAHVCMSGLTYLAIALTEAYITRKRLHAVAKAKDLQ